LDHDGRRQAGVSDDGGETRDDRAPAKPRGAKPAVPPERRRQLPPVPKGWVRGQVTSITATEEMSQIGMRSTYLITMKRPKPEPDLAVQISGLTITRRVMEGQWIEVFRGDSTVQPLLIDRIHLPVNDSWIEAFNGPSSAGRTGWVGRIGGAAMVVGPMAAILLVMLMLRFYWHTYG
jgi:hypothetical protein